MQLTREQINKVERAFAQSDRRHRPASEPPPHLKIRDGANDPKIMVYPVIPQTAPDGNRHNQVIRPSKPLFKLYRDFETTASKTWLVDKMLGAGEMSAWYGPPGCGKSVIIENMALHIAAGLPWHGRPVTRGAVVYIALERRGLVERRSIAFRTKHGLQDLPFAIVGGVYDFRQPATAEQITRICRDVEQATGETVVLIIVDTVSRALAGGDENSPKDMGALIMTSGLIQEQLPDAHFSWVHHIPHDADRLRGHGSLLGAVDTTVAVQNGGSARTAKVVKTNDGEEGEGVAFTIDGVQIAPDGTTAPIVVPIDTAGAKPSAKPDQIKRRLSDSAKLGLDALVEVITNHGEPAQPGLGLPKGTRTVTFDQWRDELVLRSVLNPKDDNWGRDYKRMREQLAGRQLIGIRDSFVWLPSTT